MRKIENIDHLLKVPQLGEIVRVHQIHLDMSDSFMIAVIVEVDSSFDPDWDAMMSPRMAVLGDQCDIIDVSIYQIASIDST